MLLSERGFGSSIEWVTGTIVPKRERRDRPVVGPPVQADGTAPTASRRLRAIGKLQVMRQEVARDRTDDCRIQPADHS